MRQLLESHHRLSGMAYGLFDAHENNLIAVGWQDICVRFHRVNPVTSVRCRESDAFIKEHLHDSAGGLLEYRCKNNMIDIAMPIVVDGRHLATFFTGQFFYDDDPPDRAFFIAQARALGFDEAEYLEALDRVPLFSREHIRGNVVFLHNMVQSLAETGVKHLQLAGEIEERRQAEEGLRRSEERYRSVVSAMSEGIVLQNADGAIEACNASAEAIMGLMRDQMMGLTSLDLDWQAVHEDLLPFPGDTHPAMVTQRTGAPCSNVIMGLRKADGTITWISLNSEPLVHPGETMPYAVVTSFTAITTRKRAELALRVSEERYRRFVEDDVAGALVTTPDGCVLACNPAFARMVGFASVDEARATNVVSLYEDPAAREAVIAEIRERGRIDHREMAWRRVDGSPLAVVNTAIGDRDERGELVAIRSHLIDISERKHLEEQLRQSQKMEAIGRLAGGIAHDFNNLLTAINGYADILVAGMAPDEPRRTDVEEIRKAGTRAAALTRQLLAFSRRQVLQAVVIDLNDVVAGIAPMLRRLVGEQIEVRAVAGPDLGHVRADPSQIEQVLLNLVVNARDAMSTGGTLTIETANVELDAEYARTHTPVAPGPYVLLGVSDTGTGMDAETMAHLFEPFFTTKPAGVGTGLGLATVYGIVTQSGGSIAAYSEPGHGAVFKVYLPRVAEAVGQRLAPVAEPVAGGAETILVVEDDDTVRPFVEHVLCGLGYTVSAARTGEDALALVGDHGRPIDLLVTDIMLPGMNGRELSERLTARQPTLRTLFISGYTEDSVIHQGVLDPGVAFLNKPFAPDALGRAVRDAIEAREVVGGVPGR